MAARLFFYYCMCYMVEETDLVFYLTFTCTEEKYLVPRVSRPKFINPEYATSFLRVVILTFIWDLCIDKCYIRLVK